jgi:hypothetical protein
VWGGSSARMLGLMDSGGWVEVVEYDWHLPCAKCCAQDTLRAVWANLRSMGESSSVVESSSAIEPSAITCRQEARPLPPAPSPQYPTHLYSLGLTVSFQ